MQIINTLEIGWVKSCSPIHKRDYSIDVLRCIAILCIMLVHVHPNKLIDQLRDFDVPLMVFLSGVVYRKKDGEGYISYLFKRFKRLILPTWVFLCVYFVISYIAKGDLIINDLVSTFTLQTQWYVWIIRVFFFIALFAPLLNKLINNWSLAKLLVYGILLVALVEFLDFKYGDNSKFLHLTFIEIPYLFVFGLGLMIKRIQSKDILMLSIGFFVSFLVCMIAIALCSGYSITGAYKYPPSLYYLSYALFCVTILWLSRASIASFLNKIHILNFTQFIGGHTLWIYFWHILMIVFLESVQMHFVVKFLIVALFAIGVTFIQSKIVEFIMSKIKNERIRKDIQCIFIG